MGSFQEKFDIVIGRHSNHSSERGRNVPVPLTVAGSLVYHFIVANKKNCSETLTATVECEVLSVVIMDRFSSGM
jgi:hypothetical protein